MPEDVMPLLETFVRVTERKRQLAESVEEESKEEEEGNQSEPDHDFWAHDADWQEYRTRVNTVAQGYQGAEDEEFSFYKKEKDPSGEQQPEESNKGAKGSNWQDNDWRNSNWYSKEWYTNNWHKDNDKWY